MKVTDLLGRSVLWQSLISIAFASVMLMGGMSPPAQAEVNIAVEFRTSLESHGRWSHDDRWGEVWIPAHVEKDWAPYTRGHWVYTDDWGWYWVSDESEAEWGWAVYHYGRWIFDPAEGWVWIPGREWAPAWVVWRRGEDRVGWAPQPPDEVYIEIRDDPQYWVFVEARDFTSDRLWREIEPGWHHTIFLQQTVIVNRTVVIRERGPIIAVNPGIEPSLIAREVGEPIRTYDVSPIVLEGTADIEGAIEVRPEEAAAKIKQQRVKQTSNLVEPAQAEEPPQPLASDESGRLGKRPPRAAEAAEAEPADERLGGAIEKPDTKGSEQAPAGEPSQTGEAPSAKPTQADKGKTAEPGVAEQAGKAAEDEAATESGPKRPGKAAEAEGKAKGKKAVTERGPDALGKAADDEGKAKGKKAATETEPERPGKAAEGEGKAKDKNAATEGGPKASGKAAEGEGKPKGKKAPTGSGPEASGKAAEDEGKPKGKKAATESGAERPGKAAEDEGKPGKKAATESGAERPGKAPKDKGKATGKKAAKEGEQPSSGGPWL